MSDEYYSFLYPNDINGRYYVGKQTKNAKGQFATTVSWLLLVAELLRNGAENLIVADQRGDLLLSGVQKWCACHYRNEIPQPVSTLHIGLKHVQFLISLFISSIEDDNLKVTTNSPPGIGSIYPPAIVYGRAERSTDNWFWFLIPPRGSNIRRN